MAVDFQVIICYKVKSVVFLADCLQRRFWNWRSWRIFWWIWVCLTNAFQFFVHYLKMKNHAFGFIWCFYFVAGLENKLWRMNHQYLMSNYLELNVNDIDDWLCIILLIIMTIFFAGLSVILFKIIYYRWEKIILIWKRFCVVRSHTCIIDFKIYFWSYLVGSSRRILTNILNRSLCGFYLFNTVHEGERKAFFKVFLLY